MISAGTMNSLSNRQFVVDALAPAPETRLRRLLRQAHEIHNRERVRMRAEILRIPGLMALLMKPRNGARWSAEDRAQLQVQLRGLGLIGLYAVTLAIPGTTLTLPLLAWWIDRRRARRENAVSEGKPGTDTTPSTPEA